MNAFFGTHPTGTMRPWSFASNEQFDVRLVDWRSSSGACSISRV